MTPSSPAAAPVVPVREAGVGRILLLSAALLLPAHLMVTAYFDSAAVNAAGAVAVITVSVGWLVKTKDEFGFLLALFVCAHFGIGDSSFGGLWSYVLCGGVFVGIALGFRPTVHLSAVPRSISALVFLFLAQQLMGTARNPYPLASNIQATILIVSQLAVFYYGASLPLDAPRARKLLAVWFVIAAWVFLASINQHYQWVTERPLLPQRVDARGAATTVPGGTFGNSELVGEYFAILVAGSLLMVSRLRDLREIGVKAVLPAVMLLLAAVGMVLSTSRAAILLAVAASACLFFWSVLLASPMQALRRVAGMGGVLLLAAVVLPQFEAFGEITQKFALLDPTSMTLESVSSGEAIDRSNVYPLGWERLGSDSWWLGYGYNLEENNHESMGIQSRWIEDFHCLYLMLPIYYGWLGAAAYVALVAGTGLRAGLWCWRARNLGHYLAPLALGFVVLWAIFLVDEAKISCTRNPSYFFMTWFWLGWTHAIANSLKKAVDASAAADEDLPPPVDAACPCG